MRLVPLLALAALLGAGQERAREEGDAAGPVRADGGDDAPAGVLLRADLAVVVHPAGDADVALDYRLRPAPGTTEVPLQALVLPGGRAVDVTVAGSVPVVLTGGAGGLLEGAVPVAEGAPAGEGIHLRLRYRVPRAASDGARDGRVRVPVIAVPWPPEEALPGTFRARATLPAGTAPGDPFPAAWVARPDGAGASSWEAELPVLPALIAFRVLDRGAFGLPEVLTWTVLALLAAVLVGGAVRLGRSP